MRITSDDPTYFLWTTDNGESLRPVEMTTTHLYHSLRMLWNHTVDQSLSLQPFTLRAGVATWPADYRREAFLALIEELSGRLKELTETQCAEFSHMLLGVARYMKALEEFEENFGDLDDSDGDWENDPFQDQTSFH